MVIPDNGGRGDFDMSDAKEIAIVLCICTAVVACIGVWMSMLYHILKFLGVS